MQNEEPSSGHNIVATYRGIDLPANKYLSENRIKAISRNNYEALEINAALKVIKEDDRVLELGAGIGIVGAIIAKNCNPEMIQSYEANPDLIEIIQGVYDANSLKNIQINHSLISADSFPPQTVPFYIHGSFLGSSLRKRARARDCVDVNVVTFEEIRKQFNPTAIVMDIEGDELNLLPRINTSSVRTISFELHPNVYGKAGINKIFSSLMMDGFCYNVEASQKNVVTFTK